ncbi:hypothetical protein PT115_09305, partial [Erysipelothrix rhusiopathiae]|nr:hypothetical protein [Erysipelothrix rhusiopathiae]
KKIAHWIHEALTHYEDDEILTRISNEVKTLTRQYPVRGERICRVIEYAFHYLFASLYENQSL